MDLNIFLLGEHARIIQEREEPIARARAEETARLRRPTLRKAEREEMFGRSLDAKATLKLNQALAQDASTDSTARTGVHTLLPGYDSVSNASEDSMDDPGYGPSVSLPPSLPIGYQYEEDETLRDGYGNPPQFDPSLSTSLDLAGATIVSIPQAQLDAIDAEMRQDSTLGELEEEAELEARRKQRRPAPQPGPMPMMQPVAQAQ